MDTYEKYYISHPLENVMETQENKNKNKLPLPFLDHSW